MVYSGIYLLPKSNSSTNKSEQSHMNEANVANNNVTSHLKHSKKLSSTGSTSNRSSESSRFNETNSNVTIKSDLNSNIKGSGPSEERAKARSPYRTLMRREFLNTTTSKFNESPKLAPEIIFLIKEHAKTLETINQISKKLQEIELKVDDISQRLSKENCSNNKQNGSASDFSQQAKTNHLKIDSSHHQKELNQTRLTYSTYKDVDQLSNHLSNNNLSNNATNIPTNQILSDDSGGEYGNKTTTKTVSDDDELLSILEKITKCSHHILQTQQAYQQQGTAIYSSLSKPYAYSQTNQSVSNQFNQSGPHVATNQLANSHNLPGRQYILDVFSQPPQQQHLYSAINPYLLNAKSSIKSTNQSNIHQQIIVPTMQFSQAPTVQQQQAASLNELLFEPNVERFLSNLDQLVCNDDTNLAAILGTNQQQPNPINSINIPMLQHSQNQQFIPVSPHQASTPISSQPPMPILSNGNHLTSNLRTNQCSNLSPSCNNMLINSNYGNNMMNVQHNQSYNMNISSVRDSSTANNLQQQQQFLNWKKAKELLEKKERERIGSQLKQADEWLGMVDNCINHNAKYQSTKSSSTKQHPQGNNEGRPNI